ncbi:MAG: hypothetical protein GXP02_09655, partial [Alphaproteobacteria bacterium]|nr:hypothetical protein [Alphaproteobacteria bacterium]
MSEIDITQYIPLKTDEGSPRVARTSPTSDDSSAQQQSPDQNSPSPKKTAESSQKPAVHETAVTISATLSNLEAGSRIKANYLGVDGQDRPLITAKTGTYTVKYAPEYQPEINKIPQGAVLEVKILKIDREIEARLIFRDPGAKDKTAISLAVTLELTSLGDAPPRSRAIPGKDNLPPGQQQLSYQATDLYRAENIARESDRKLNQLPPSATSPNYTLYEKAVPQKDRPAMASATATRPPIAGNALIAQEQVIKTPLKTPDTGPAATTPQDGIRSAEINFAKLLYKNTLATVIKTFTAATENLPEIIQKNLGNTGILTTLDTGRNFTLKIES